MWCNICKDHSYLVALYALWKSYLIPTPRKIKAFLNRFMFILFVIIVHLREEKTDTFVLLNVRICDYMAYMSLYMYEYFNKIRRIIGWRNGFRCIVRATLTWRTTQYRKRRSAACHKTTTKKTKNKFQIWHLTSVNIHGSLYIYV